jgi:hypothetical protein
MRVPFSVKRGVSSDGNATSSLVFRRDNGLYGDGRNPDKGRGGFEWRTVPRWAGDPTGLIRYSADSLEETHHPGATAAIVYAMSRFTLDILDDEAQYATIPVMSITNKYYKPVGRDRVDDGGYGSWYERYRNVSQTDTFKVDVETGLLPVVGTPLVFRRPNCDDITEFGIYTDLAKELFINFYKEYIKHFGEEDAADRGILPGCQKIPYSGEELDEFVKLIEAVGKEYKALRRNTCSIEQTMSLMGLSGVAKQ